MDIDKREEKPLSDTQQYWKVMTFYERLEHIVALILGAIISVIMVLALLHLIHQVFVQLVLVGLDPLEHRVFQSVFGMIMTLLIAMEFRHSIIEVLHRHGHIIHVKTVILIALLALARKFIILDSIRMDAGEISALGFVTLVLGIVYWLIKERDI
jgi:uncharacterized membrane protein (DUF373 family)